MIKLDIENKEAVLRWLEQIKKGTGDARPLWKAMTPKIIQFVDNQFQQGSSANKTWKPIKHGYKRWKAKKGFSTGVGVMTDTLKRGAGVQAKKKYKKKFLEWKVNNSLVNPFSKKTLGSYVKHFDKVRPVYDNTIIRVNSFLTTDIQSFNGGSYNNFTYAWLRKSLRPNL